MANVQALDILFQYDLLPIERRSEIEEEFAKSADSLGSFLVGKKLLTERKLYRFLSQEMGMNRDIAYRYKDFEVVGRTLPKYRTSGDFFGIFPLANSRVAVTLCDVAGKGLEAALLTIHLADLLNHRVDMTSLVPSSIMKKINQISRSFFEIDRYSTFVFIIIDLLSGTVEYSSAGSPPILRFNSQNNQIEELDIHNIPVGIFDDFQYKGRRTELNRGDVILAFTDGAYEGENLKGEAYGIARIKRIFRNNALKLSLKLLRSLIFDWKWHSLFRRQADDTTYLLIRRYKKKH